MLKLNKFVVLLCLAALVLPSCASLGGSDYSRTDERRAMNIQYGSLLAVREVTISNEPTGTGTTLGAITGGVLGSLLGSGRGRVVGAVGGAVVGAVGGTAVEKGIADGKAWELTVRLDTGQEIVVVQDKDDIYTPGEKVRVVTAGNGVTRVQRFQ